MGWAKIVFTDSPDGTVAVSLELNEELNDSLLSHQVAVESAELVAKVAASYQKAAEQADKRIVTLN